MFLKSLKIINGVKKEVIRDISFKRGLNLIIDETPETDNHKKTSNNIGKTTVLRLIDFCLGGNKKNIYQDPEFKNRSNEKVESFLINEKVLIVLILEAEDKEVIVERNFLERSRKILRINGKDINGDAKLEQHQRFDFELKKEILGFKEEKPTFKQIRAKNVRDDAERLNNTVKVLGNFGKNEEYEALYLFWLGIPYKSATRKQVLLDDKKAEQRIYDRLTKNTSESRLNQSLMILERQIEELKKRRNNFSINGTYEKELKQLNKVKSELNIKCSRISRLSMRKELVEESRQSLEGELVDVNYEELELLYKKANALIPDLQKSFEDTLVFHNQMIQGKIEYITQELPKINKELRSLDVEVHDLLSRELHLTEKLKKIGVVEDMQSIMEQLNKFYEDKGKYTEQLSGLRESGSKLEEIKEELDKIDKAIEDLDAQVQGKIEIFNTYFADISQGLYEESFALSASFEKIKNSNNGFYKLSVDAVSARAGTGKKKGEILAFDLAYIKFADAQNIRCLHFVLHDQMEIVDNNQISTFLKEISNANCQFIMPVLRDKMPTDLQTGAYEVLSLSQSSKLFKI